MFDGAWTGGNIVGSTLTWNNGVISAMSITAQRQFTLTTDRLHTAVLKDDGKLHWDDGDVWEKVTVFHGAVLAEEAMRTQVGREFLESSNPTIETGSESRALSQVSEEPKAKSKLATLFRSKTSGTGESYIDKWSSGFEKLKSGLDAKKEELMEQNLPHLRELRHKAKDWQLNVKEQVNDFKQKKLNQVVSGLELHGAEHAATASATAANEVLEAQRWWAEVCKAAHDLHNLELDPPKPPERAFSDAQGVGPDKRARGCLEVEVISFGAEPPISLPSGDAARLPVCQLAVGNRYTGALLPRASYRKRCDSTEEADEAADEIENSKKHEESNSEANCIARFPIDEINGCDLRLYVFDSKAHKFRVGKEEEAFCGGALIPLSVLTGRQESWARCVEGFRTRQLENEVHVNLLPLEAVRMVRKLKPPTDIRDSFERPSPELGNVSLRLQLTLYDMAPGGLYTAMPFSSDAVEASGADQGKLDDPMSVLKGVAAAVQRIRRALNLDFWGSVANDLRESPGTASILHVLWAAAMLLVSVWKLPAIILALVVLVVLRVSSLSKAARKADPPRLYSDEFEEDTTLTLKERGKKGLASAVKVELGMMKLAQTLNTAAATLEKINYLLMLRDPYLSIIFGGVLVGFAFVMTVGLAVFLAIFGRFGPPLLLWALGSLLLLPRPARDRLMDILEWMQEMKIRYVGEGKIPDICESLWARIPDEVEAQHCDIFDRYCAR